MKKIFKAKKLYQWNRCIPVGERSDWELAAYNPDDYFGTSLLFHNNRSEYALGAVSETGRNDCFYHLRNFAEIFFASRQTENIWAVLACFDDMEYLLRIRFETGQNPLVLNIIPLESEVSRCMINRRGHILIGYDNSSYYSEPTVAQTTSGFTNTGLWGKSGASKTAQATGTVGFSFPGQRPVPPLLEWYDAEGKLLYLFSDNLNTSITELNIDSNDNALAAADLSEFILRLSEDKISYISDPDLPHFTICGLTETPDRSGCLITYSLLPSGSESSDTEDVYKSVWMSAGEKPAECAVFSEEGKELPLNGYSCRANVILIESEGWIYRVGL